MKLTFSNRFVGSLSLPARRFAPAPLLSGAVAATLATLASLALAPAAHAQASQGYVPTLSQDGAGDTYINESATPIYTTAPTGTATNPTVVNGQGQGGLMVLSGTVSISNENITNFTTTGGAGSGGGAGLGGAIFVSGGATVKLSNVKFTGNTVVGGLGNVNGGGLIGSAGGVGSGVGGTLNNMGSVLQTGTGLPGGPAATNITYSAALLALPGQMTAAAAGKMIAGASLWKDAGFAGGAAPAGASPSTVVDPISTGSIPLLASDALQIAAASPTGQDYMGGAGGIGGYGTPGLTTTPALVQAVASAAKKLSEDLWASSGPATSQLRRGSTRS